MHCYISPSSECLFLYLNESYTLLYVNKYVLRFSSWIFLWEKKCQTYVILWQMSLSYVLIHSMYFISYFRFFTSRHYLVNISCTCSVWRNNFHTYHLSSRWDLHGTQIFSESMFPHWKFGFFPSQCFYFETKFPLQKFPCNFLDVMFSLQIKRAIHLNVFTHSGVGISQLE